MKELIDKDALVAEIEKRIRKLNEKCGEVIEPSSIISIELCKNECKLILNIINTIKVKEVDLEDEIDKEFIGCGKIENVTPDECLAWLEKRCEKKSKWTEEDECYMGECISAIATKDSWSFEEKRKIKHWLKSIKKRMEEQQ